MSDALVDLATRGRTSNKMIQDVNIARLFNQRFGTSYGPWDVDNIPEEWIKLLIQITTGMEGLSAARAEKTRIIGNMERNHDTYIPIPKR